MFSFVVCCFVSWIIVVFDVLYVICRVDVCRFEIDVILMMFFLVFFKVGVVVCDMRKILFKLVVIM